MTNVTEDIQKLLNEFSSCTKNVTSFLSSQPNTYKKLKSTLKRTYDATKKSEYVSNGENASLKSLIIDNFDTEQIWQQIELQNKFISTELNDRLAQYIRNNNVVLSDGEETDNEEEVSEKNGKSKSISKSIGSSSEEEEDESDASDEESLNLEDDDSIDEEGDEKVDEEEDGEDDDANSDESIDYFQDIPSEDEDESGKKNKFGPMYSDFFDDDAPKAPDDPEKMSKRVKFDLPDDMSEEETEILEEDTGVRSSFEERQERLRQNIEKLEETALSEKPWHMGGEVNAKKRPQNSLLEQNLEFDLTVRPAPIITEEVAQKLEDIIIQRIKDKAWDDVERKIKPVDTPFEFKKKLVLNQEKSKQSLAQIYEQEYLKRVDAANPDKEKQQEEPKEHKQLKFLLDNLFKKLDALSNYHYTPRQAMPELKIINNLPAISMEEAIPTTVSDAALLAPEEVQSKKRGDLVGKEERTSTDMKRDRRHKKLRQRQKQKEIQKREKYLQKVKPGLGNKYSKEKIRKELEDLSKKGAISKFEADSDTRKSGKSSKQFFDRLQDTVSNNVQVKKGRKSGSKIKAVHIKL